MDNTIFKGKLKRWNEDKGFGFIGSENRSEDIFIHVSALKTMSRRPINGDIILYQIHTDNDGKKRAVNAKIEGVAVVQPRARRRNKTQNKNQSSTLYKLFLVVLIIILSSLFYDKVLKKNPQPKVIPSSSVSIFNEEVYEETYRCEGKVYCSEMTSCEEAKFYQRSCSGTKMDGDGDGIPCESQWCGW